MSRAVLLPAALLAAGSVAHAQPHPLVDSLPRHAMVGAAVEPLGADSGGVRVTVVTPGFTAAGLGLRAGDVITSVDGREIRTLIDYARAFRAWRAPGTARVSVRRAGKTHALRGAVVPRPRETGEGIAITYGSIVSDSGDRLRTIVTKPAAATGRLPAIVLVNWLSCSTVEFASASDRPGWQHVLHGLSRAGYLVFRVDKPGVGDSRGPDCSDLRYWREVAAYRAALAATLDLPDVDTSAVFLFGGSLGGAIAPIVARGQPVRGVMVSGTYARTWYEHILDHERRRLELSDVPPPDVDAQMRALEEIYAAYLIGGRTPAQAIAGRAALARAWTDMPRHQYGRPAAFFQDLQRVNVAEAWGAVLVPVLAVYGEYDWSMAREDHELVARLANRRREGHGELVVIPEMDHHFMRYPDRLAAFKEEGGTVARDALERIVEWLNRVRTTGG